MKRDGVVHSIAEEANRRAQRSLGLDDPRLLLGGDPREDRCLGERGRELLVVEPVDLGTGERPFDLETDVMADLLSDAIVVAGDDLYRDVQPLEAGECVARIVLGTIDERQKSGQGQVVLVIGRQRRTAVGSARCDGDHSRAGGELCVQHRLGF